jgi:peptidoglycan-associated lipoprotein
MKRIHVLTLLPGRGVTGLAILAGLLAGTTGCATSKGAATAEPVAEAPAPAPAPEPAKAPAPEEPQMIPVQTQSIYFDFDRYDLKPDATSFLSDFGGLLAKHPELSVRIEGNCDERGTAAYNIALGYKRADAAQQYLERMGARGSQISTVSYGKDRPRAMGHDESAWSQNRRDDFVPDRATVSANP